MTIHEHRERRKHTRTPLVRDCRVRDHRMIGYAAGKTSDISPGGALIQVDRTRAFGAGDELEVAVAWDHVAVLSSERTVRAVVRRVMPIDYHSQALAIEFKDSAPMKMAA
ncbi:MAG TPA: PilZ domain-containing protein [Phycisphaerales bacterium]|nr:PilZ domain-containing protein [Phycisphaerales bacterium]